MYLDRIILHLDYIFENILPNSSIHKYMYEKTTT